MAVNKIVYGEKTLIDLTGDTVTPESLRQGFTAHDKSGTVIVGTYVGGGNISIDDVDNILFYGFSSGEIEIQDKDFVIVATNRTTGDVLTKTFSSDKSVCEVVLKNKADKVLGKLTKTTSENKVVYVNEHNGTTIEKTFSDEECKMTQIVTNTTTKEVLSSLTKKLV